MFLVYYSKGFNSYETVLCKCYINALYSTKTCNGVLGHRKCADIVRSGRSRSRVSPVAARVGRYSCDNDAFIKVGTHQLPSPTTTKVKARYSLATMPSQVIVNWPATYGKRGEDPPPCL
jgi:hypothetical protein